MCVCVFSLCYSTPLPVLDGCLCEGVHHGPSVKPDLWGAESKSLSFLLYYVIPTYFLWLGLLMPLTCMWHRPLSFCKGLFFFPIRWAPISQNPVVGGRQLSPARCFRYWCCCFPCSLLLCLECFSSPQSQPELSRNAMPPINLERWYQDIMAAGEPQSSCPPPLPAKSFSSRRHGQVNAPLFLTRRWTLLCLTLSSLDLWSSLWICYNVCLVGGQRLGHMAAS